MIPSLLRLDQGNNYLETCNNDVRYR